MFDDLLAEIWYKSDTHQIQANFHLGPSTSIGGPGTSSASFTGFAFCERATPYHKQDRVYGQEKQETVNRQALLSANDRSQPSKT